MSTPRHIQRNFNEILSHRTQEDKRDFYVTAAYKQTNKQTNKQFMRHHDASYYLNDSFPKFDFVPKPKFTLSERCEYKTFTSEKMKEMYL